MICMPSLLPTCTRCKTPLPERMLNRAELEPCPSCSAPLQVEIFPALFRPVTPGRDGERLMVEGESSCFYHPEKKAALPCEGCGRFLCALCDCELAGRHFCPACLETGKQKGRIKNLENQRTLYGNVALALTLYPLIFYFFTFITAPVALFVAIRYWNAPRSIVRPTRVYFVAAIFFALVEIAAWTFIIYSMFAN